MQIERNIVLRYCENDNVMRAGESSIKITPRGSLYVAQTLSDRWPADIKHARIGWDDETGLLVLEPAAVDTPGARTVTSAHKNQMRLRFITSLKFFGLLPLANIKLPAQWIHGRIEAIVPGHGAKVSIAAVIVETPAAKENRPAELPRDLAKGVALEAAIEFEDSAPPAAGLLLDAKEIQQEFGITQAYLYVLCSKGKFPKSVSKRGHAFLWRRADIEAWTAQRVRRRPGMPKPISGARTKPEIPPDDSPVGQPRCSNCAAGLRMHENGGVCGNQASPRFANRVLPRDRCPEHKPWREKHRVEV